MKKLITSLVLTACLSASAQVSSQTAARFIPLLSGYNVLVPTNTTAAGQFGAGAYATLGQSNTLYTSYAGQELYSLTNNNTFGSSNSVTITQQNTNTIAPDAFKIAHIVPDVNGDFNANATLVLVTGYTNYEPNLYWATNSFGQVYLTNWPLALSQSPNWQYPATPNTYPTWPASSTNTVVITLFGGAGNIAGVSDSTSGGAILPKMFTSSSIWSASFNVAAGVGNVVMTNIPTGVMQQCKDVYAEVTVTPAAGLTGTTNQLINQLGILQPQP